MWTKNQITNINKIDIRIQHSFHRSLCIWLLSFIYTISKNINMEQFYFHIHRHVCHSLLIINMFATFVIGMCSYVIGKIKLQRIDATHTHFACICMRFACTLFRWKMCLFSCTAHVRIIMPNMSVVLIAHNRRI